ncbi:hypothetical protein AAOGI_26360 [Agarivorans albus]
MMDIAIPYSHKHCFACGTSDSSSTALNLRFTRSKAGGVEAAVSLNKIYQGYSGVLHGGIISTLLDAAMTHRLFAEGVEAMTADLHIRFAKPVPVNHEVILSADIDSSIRGVFTLSSKLYCEQSIYASAKAKFMRANTRASASFPSSDC